MPYCTSIDPFITPYVDGELPQAERQLVDDHLRVCGPCHTRVVAERAVRELVGARRTALDAGRASPALRARCAKLAERPASWRARLVPLAFAATLVLLVGGAFLYEATDRSARLLAAELTADHVKCFAMSQLFGTNDSPVAVEQSMLARFGWRISMPEQLPGELRLVGGRLCLYGEGKVAHLLCRYRGQPVSIFMVPNAVRQEQLFEVMGHEAAIWSVGDRTFVLIASEPRAEVERMASMVQAALR